LFPVGFVISFFRDFVAKKVNAPEAAIEGHSGLGFTPGPCSWTVQAVCPAAANSPGGGDPIMRFIIYGAGGIGSGIGGHLWRTGHEAVLIGRSGHVGRIQAAGLRLITGTDEYHLDVPAVTHPREIHFRADDVVLLTMKSHDTEAALRELRAAGGDPWELPIFCVQNGIANESMAARYFRRVYGVLIVIPGIFLEDGVVHNPIRGNAGMMDIGLYPRGVDATAEQAAAALTEASYEARVHPDVMGPKARKLLGNLGNALGAITDGRGDGGPYLAEARREGERCLEAHGHPIESEASFRERCRARRGETALPEGMRNLGSSWQSLTRRQGSIEADFLNGEIVLLGRKHGIPTPFNAVLQRIANDMAAAREPPGKYAAEELFAMAERLAMGDPLSPGQQHLPGT
jgi:2-dehydropantoate 2-reductase